MRGSPPSKASAKPVRRSWSLGALQGAPAAVAAKGRQIETEAASIRYVAAVFGVTESGDANPAADRAHGVVL